MSTRNEILDNMRARDTQLTDLLTQQNASFDTKYNDSLAAIANIASMIAASNTNNNNNNSTNNNDTNARPRAVTTDTPYTSEVDFVPVTPQVPTNTIQSGMELFPPSGRDQPVTLLSALGPEPTNIKLEHTDDQQPIWYGAPSGTLFPNVTGDIPVWSPDPSVRALIAEQAKVLDQYKAMAAHSAHLRQQSEERRSPLTDRKAPTVMGMQQTLMSSSTQRPINPDDRRQPLADLKVPSDTFTAPNVSNRGQPQASAPAQSPASEGANTSNEGSIRSLQEQLHIIQEILMARDSKEIKSNAPPKNTKVYCSMPMHDDDNEKETYQSEVKDCQPNEIPFALKDLPEDLRSRIFKHINQSSNTYKEYENISVKDGFINIPIPEEGVYHKLPKASDRPRSKGYNESEKRSDPPIKERRPPAKQQYNTYSYNNPYNNDSDDDDEVPPLMFPQGPPHMTYHSPNPMRGKMYVVRDGREGLSPEVRREHEERRMAIAGKYIQLHEALDAQFDRDNGPIRLKMASQKEFPHVALNDLELDSVIRFFAVYDLERGRHSYNLRWKMSMFIHPTVLIRLGVVASNNRWDMDKLPGGSAAHADDRDLRFLIQEEVRAKSYDDFMNKMNQVPFFEKPEDEGFRPEAYTFDEFIKYAMNYAERFCARAEIMAAGAHGEHIPYVHKKDNIKGIFHRGLQKFPAETGTSLWEKCAFANPELRATKGLRDLFQKFFAVLDPYKQGRLISDDFNTVIKRADLVGKSFTSRVNDARKDKPDAPKGPDKSKRTDLNTTRIYGQGASDISNGRSAKGTSISNNDNITTPTAFEEDTREYTDEEFDMMFAAMEDEKIRPCHVKFQHGECETPGCTYDHSDKAMQTVLKKRIWDLAKAAYRPEASKFLTYIDHAVKTVDEEKKTGSKKTA